MSARTSTASPGFIFSFGLPTARAMVFALMAVVAGGAIPGSAQSAPLPDSQDTAWAAKSSPISFEVTLVAGGINDGGDLEFGLYDLADPSSRTPVFQGGIIAVGDTNAVSASGNFGFYISNIGAGFGGGHTYFSDSSLNVIPPPGGPPGLDAMAAEALGADVYSIEFEDLTLPLTPGAGSDLIVTVGEIEPVFAELSKEIISGPDVVMPLDNGGFERGNTSQWAETIPPGGFIAVVPFFAGNVAQEGSLFAGFKTNGPGSFTTLSLQIPTASVGDMVSGYAFFFDGEGGVCSFDDTAEVEITGGTVSPISLFSASSCTTSTVGWTLWSYTFDGSEGSGPFTLQARIANGGNSASDSVMGLDGVQTTFPVSDGEVDLAVEVGQGQSTEYDFEISFATSPDRSVLVQDTVPAEWNASLLDDDGGSATATRANKRGKGAGATKIDWTTSGGSISVWAGTRAKRRNGKFSPTSCGALRLNDGAQAFDPTTGEPLLDLLGNPVESNALCLVAVPDIDGGGIVPDGTGDEDGDRLLDHLEACTFGTDPCLADTDGDGFDDFIEVSLGSDPLSAASIPATVRLENATTPDGNVFTAAEGNVGIFLESLGGSLSGEVAWIGKGGVPGSEVGCDAAPLDLTLDPVAVPYGESVVGKIALIQRGLCSFSEKVAVAEAQGAIGVIIYNIAGDGVVQMAPILGWPIAPGIPAVFIGQTDGEAMAALREAGVPDPLLATLTELIP